MLNLSLINPNCSSLNDCVASSGKPGDRTNSDGAEVVMLLLKCLVFGFIILLSILGNLLIIISVLLTAKLRTLTNYFVTSLALADLLVALLAMTFKAAVEVMAGRWLFGRAMCDVWNSCDVLFSTASILHLCCISLDRYVAITDPLHYPQRMTRLRVLVMLATVWASSACISFIPIHLQWYTTETHYLEMLHDPELCEFKVNQVYALVSSTVSFWAPAVIMICTYARVYREASRQEKQIARTRLLGTPCLQRRVDVAYDGSGDIEGEVIAVERTKMRREHKAAKTLGIIMSAFLLCWLPFFSWYVAVHLCGEPCHSPTLLVDILFWIGYFNSTLNPMIYAYFNRDFRQAFQSTLKRICWCVTRDRKDPFSSSSTSKSHVFSGKSAENLPLQREKEDVRAEAEEVPRDEGSSVITSRFTVPPP